MRMLPSRYLSLTLNESPSEKEGKWSPQVSTLPSLRFPQ